ncbi:hypothetical protein BO99DRAFT_455544 [Aspergillus violaceofuscus CBS 115571]|uniref:RBR-type E3 ubiquitin transferase n=1 Tax=Aspergillus violaceofuscus (strain CBS 115571) TaxID=1450538 RepID=A0A2V5HJ81_ASPV1|nr:hypothetical protein BO99DRAFT_455544 [Aspergillus violaceofuscus CBS 115571]
MTTLSIGEPRSVASNNDIHGEDARGGQNTTNLDCCVCLEKFQQNEVTRVGCDHTYCHGCIRELFVRSLHDQTLFPPRCCGQEIQLALVEGLLNEEELDNFNNRHIEHTTAHPVYCGNRACGAFVRPELITGDRARCTGCLNLTCTMCMSPYHFDADCPEDPAIQNTLALANQEGWQRCPSCRTVVQLDRGCNHMTCHCGTQFCYRCGARWRTCACAQWEQGHPFAEPQWVMPPPLARDHGPRVRELEDTMQELREFRNIALHLRGCLALGHFRRRHDGGERGFHCELCHSNHRWYILECLQCGRQICERCRRNRN